MKKIILTICMLCAMTMLLGGCGKKNRVNQFEGPKNGDTIAIIHTNEGDISIRLFPSAAPKAVENFVTLAKSGYYNGITFHRVMADFMIQSGDPTGTGRGGQSCWGGTFEDEFSDQLHNVRGALSMANTGDADSNGSQFFIVQAKTIPDGYLEAMKNADKAFGFTDEVIDYYAENGGTPWLDLRHTVFGQVYEGMDVVDEIASVMTDENDRPVIDMIIESVEIKTYGK